MRVLMSFKSWAEIYGNNSAASDWIYTFEGVHVVLNKAMFCSVNFSLQTLKEATQKKKTLAVKFYNNKRKYRSNPQIT